MSIILYGAPLSPFVRKADAVLLSKRDSFAPCIAICRKIVKQDPIDLRKQA